MNETLAIAAASMGFDIERLQSIAHNLANVSTTGYKRGILNKQVGVPAFDHQMQLAGMAAALDINAIDTRPGALRSTGNPLDLAIEGTGFFEVRTPNGVAYTRSGEFQLDRQGQLTTSTGFPVMGTNGTIALTTSTPKIDNQGRIFEKNEQTDQIKVVSFSDTSKLNYLGDGLYDVGTTHTADTQQSNALRQGFVEASNVSSMHEMVRMIETLRHFESMQKVVQGMDSIQNSVISKLGQF